MKHKQKVKIKMLTETETSKHIVISKEERNYCEMKSV